MAKRLNIKFIPGVCAKCSLNIKALNDMLNTVHVVLA
jgi:hypothetical protein